MVVEHIEDSEDFSRNLGVRSKIVKVWKRKKVRALVTVIEWTTTLNV